MADFSYPACREELSTLSFKSFLNLGLTPAKISLDVRFSYFQASKRIYNHFQVLLYDNVFKAKGAKQTMR